MPRATLVIIACLILLSAAPFANASGKKRALPYQGGEVAGWKATVSDYAHAPSFLIAVDKKDQLLTIFERKSPLAKIAEYTCTTGQNEGDKLVEGDLKTPEGVYFIVSHINKGLNFELYGYEAYPLNYPNPVDRIRKKTGSGIWIHGKGIPLVPYDSNGCVGMFNQDIATLKEKPILGQPVTLAVNIEHNDQNNEKAAIAAQLVRKVEDWAKAWSNRSPEMFDFYSPEAYSIAQGQSFDAFKAQKKYLFSVLPWINTSVHDIQVLEGPGYWVTWFNQDYKAPNMTSFGTRRLYWQPDADGEMRIVGMEWLKGFKSPVLYAEKNPSTYSDATTLADASASGTQSKATAAQDNTKAGAKTPADKNAQTEKVTSLAEAKTSKPEGSNLPQGNNARQDSQTAKKDDKAELVASAETAAAKPEKTAAQQQQKTVADKNTKETDITKTELAQNTLPQSGGTEKAQTEIDRKRVDKEFLTQQEAREFINTWQESWKNTDIDAYMSCYAPNAKQGWRQGSKAIADQKRKIWSRVRVVRLDLSHISIEPNGAGFKAVMQQDYADSNGYADKGVKVLYLEHDQNWRIVREDWKALVSQ